MKDHQIAQLINQLCSIAEEFAGTQQLRERLAVPIRAAFRSQEERVLQVCPVCDIAECRHIRANKCPYCLGSGQQTTYGPNGIPSGFTPCVCLK